MNRRKLLVAGLLGLCALLGVGHLQADAVRDRLSGLIVTEDDISDTGLHGGPAGGGSGSVGVSDFVSVFSVFKQDTRGGQVFAYVELRGATAGTSLEGLRRSLSTDSRSRSELEDLFDSAAFFAQGNGMQLTRESYRDVGPYGAGDTDVEAQMTGVFQGVRYQMYGDIFFQGEIECLVVYGAPGAGAGIDGLESILDAQSANLP